MADLVPTEVREWLIGEMSQLIATRGEEPFLRAPIREPTPQDFPDHFEATERGVRVLIRRILSYAGLQDLEIELDTFSQPDVVRELDDRGEAKQWGHQGAAAWFAGIEEGRCHFGIAVERIGEPITLVATLCHEVAHAWRAVHGLTTADRDTEERLTDLTTVYLGFGLLTTNGAYLYRASGVYEGTKAYTQWSHTRGGYLGPEAMSFLLAVQVKARGLGWFARRRVAGQLETNQAAYFKWALGKLGDTRELSGVLGIGATQEEPLGRTWVARLLHPGTASPVLPGASALGRTVCTG